LTGSEINASAFQSPTVALSVVGSSASFRLYRGVETLYGGDHTLGITTQGGATEATIEFTCTDLQLAFYDANNRVKSLFDNVAYYTEAVTAGTIVAIARNAWANALVSGDAAAALAEAALLRGTVFWGAAIDSYGADLVTAMWNRNVIAGLMRVKGCM
jgi:hypothetical protein